MRIGRRTEMLLIYSLVIINVIFFIYPIFHLFLVSIQPSKYILWSLFPHELAIRNYQVAFSSERGFARPLLNSLLISTVSTILVVAVSSLAAFSLTRFEYRLRENVAFFILSLYMLPPIATLIPLWHIVKGLQLTDNQLFLSILYSFLNMPFTTWLLRGFFVGISREVEEASLIDGCSRLGSFRRVLLPLALPGIAVAAIFSFIFSWNEFLFASVFTEVKARTVTVAISAEVSYFIDWGALSAMNVVAVVPVLLLGIVIQRYIVSGLTLGAVKG